jgi:hypothetical protein
MVTMYFCSAIFLAIIQKVDSIFLEPGYTQQQEDALQACIERAETNMPVFTIGGRQFIFLLER